MDTCLTGAQLLSRTGNRRHVRTEYVSGKQPVPGIRNSRCVWIFRLKHHNDNTVKKRSKHVANERTTDLYSPMSAFRHHPDLSTRRFRRTHANHLTVRLSYRREVNLFGFVYGHHTTLTFLRSDVVLGPFRTRCHVPRTVVIAETSFDRKNRKPFGDVYKYESRERPIRESDNRRR